jgi:nucleolar protein 56
MESYVSLCVGGVIAFDKDFRIIDYERFKEDKAHLRLIENLNKEVLDEEIGVINRIAKNHTIINIESDKKLSDYNAKVDDIKLEVNTTNPAGEYLRGNLEDILLNIGFESKETIRKTIVNTFNKISRLKMKESSQEEDKLLIQSINAIDEIDESIAKLVERMREWYAVYFPELEIVNRNEVYIKLIANIGDRDEIIKNHLENLDKELNLDEGISNGADLETEDLEVVKEFAESIKSLQKSRKSIEKYIDIKMDSIAPNLKNLIGSSLAAKLIAHVGSIKKLALYPSGTVQILGAEKALFRHLKTGENPPKHGLIFQHPDVRTSKWWIRGKIARNLALKISLAVRTDFFNGKLDTTIKEDFIKRVEEIKRDNPFPKKPSRNNKSKDKHKRKNTDKGKRKKKNKY